MNYEIRITGVKVNKVEVAKALKQAPLGLDDNKIKDLIQNGGTVYSGKNKQIASKLQERLLTLKVEVDLITNDGDVEKTKKEDKKSFLVSGLTLNSENLPLKGIHVRLFQKSIGNLDEISRTTTNENGEYKITFDPEKIPVNNTSNIHVIAKAYSPATTNETIIGSSKMRKLNRKNEKIDIEISSSKHVIPTTYDIIANQTAKYDLNRLVNVATQNDVKLLAKETGLKVKLINLFLKARIFSLKIAEKDKSKIIESVSKLFFAYLASEKSKNVISLLELRDAQIKSLILKAENNNLVKFTNKDSFLNTFRSLRITYKIKNKEPWLKTLIENGIGQKTIQTFLDAYYKSNTSKVAVIEQLIETGKIVGNIGKILKDTLALIEFSISQPELLQAIKEEFEVKNPKDLAKISKSDWSKIVKKHTTPPQNVEKNIYHEELATGIYQSIEKAYPTEVFHQELIKDKKINIPALQNWFKNNESFDFTKDNIEEYQQENKINIPLKQKETLLRAENLFHLSPNHDRITSFKSLWLADYQGADAILQEGRGGFNINMKKQGLTEKLSTNIYKNAQHQQSLGLLSQQALTNIHKVQTDSDQPVKIEPTIAALFGDKGSNGCEHCISAFSPSAYLIDMLRFLERSNTSPDLQGKSGAQLLFERRPDIKNLQLNCENSHTPLPYIDLVNELLEHVVATSSLVFKIPDDWLIESSLDLQTTWTAEELAAHPEYLQKEAYNKKLRVNTAPWGLPYNLWADEVRTYLAQVITDRTEIMAIVRPDSNKLKLLEVATERLGIDPTEAFIVVNPANNAAKRTLIWQTGNPAVDLKNVRKFLKRASMSFEDVEGIFTSYFVNPDDKQIIPTDLSDLDNANFTFTSTDNNGLLDRFHRFTRIINKTGWHVSELDAALQNIAKSAKLDSFTLANLGTVAELYHRFKTPIDEIATWFGNLYTINYRDKKSIYYRNFVLNSVNAIVEDSALNLIDDVFNIKGRGSEAEMAVIDLQDTEHKWLAKNITITNGEDFWELHPESSMTVLAGCNISSSELFEIIDHGHLTTLNNEILLNLANVSEIFRQASMARALGISISELLDWQKLIGYPLGPSRTELPGPAGTLLYLILIETHIAKGIDVGLLLYALQNIAKEDGNIAPSEEDIDEWVTQIREQLIAEKITYAVDQNSTIDFTATILQALSDFSEIEIAQVEELIKARPANTEDLTVVLASDGFLDNEATTIENAKDGLQLLMKQAALVSVLGLNAEEIAFTNEFYNDLTLLDFSTLGNANLSNWYNLFQLKQIDEDIQYESDDIYAFLTDLLNNSMAEQEAYNRLAILFNVTTKDIELLTAKNAINIQFPNGYKNIQLLHRLQKACWHLTHLGIEAEKLLKLAEPITNIDAANIAKAAVKKHYDHTSWAQVSGKLRSNIRERQRDALVEFVRTRGGLDLSHEQVYAFYLIDVDMGACFTTSRTKQAIASVQQFIQRILLGLEFDPSNGKALDFFKEDAAEWKWRKNYRVWEANVKVFAYPENWLEPDLRDDKTPFFKEFEQALMQGELNNELAENAVTGYLERLHEVSQLEIINLYDYTKENTVYVVARTSNYPHAYYLRKWQNKEVWTPWEKIDVEIESEQVILGVYSGELYVCWPSFNEQLNEEDYSNDSIHNQISDLENELDDLQDELNKAEKLYDTYNEMIGDQAYSPVQQYIKEQKAKYDAEKERINTEIEILDAELKDLTDNKNVEIKAKYTYQEIDINWIKKKRDKWSGKFLSKGYLKGEEGVTPYEYRFTIDSNKVIFKINVYGSDIPGKTRNDDKLLGYFQMDNCTGDMNVVQSIHETNNDWIFFNNGHLINTKHFILTVIAGIERDLSLHDGTVILSKKALKELSGVTGCIEESEENCFFIADRNRTFFFIKTSETPKVNSTKNIEKNLTTDSILDKNYEYQKRGLPTKRIKQEPLQDGFFDELELGKDWGKEYEVPDLKFDVKYKVTEHYHAYACAYLRQVRRFGVESLYAPDPNVQGTRDSHDLVRQKTDTLPKFNFETSYLPNRQVVEGEPREVIDFSYGSAYDQYNWEVFFHIPMMIATRLTQNQKFEEAQQWFHYIFEPTAKDGIGMEKYWKVKPFYYAQLWGASYEDLEEQLERVDDTEGMSLDTLINEWEANPFQPYAIARFRIVAFMRMTVMKYLDNLIAWGDQLFRQDTMESINEATQLYILAHNILGERPLLIENNQSTQFKTVDELLNTQSVLTQSVQGNGSNLDTSLSGAQGILGVLGQFCLPFNDHMLDYWDTVSDRLFKIRNCLNIDGVFRKLPLFQPPIDPALLVNAAASGVNLASVVGSLTAPLPHYRFNYILQKAVELIENVKSLGNQLLSISEKRDAETLSLMKSEQEIELLKLNTDIKREAIRELKNQKESIEQNKNTIEIRLNFYKNRKHLNLGESLDLILRGVSWYFRVGAQIAEASSAPLTFIPRATAGLAGIASPVGLMTTQKPQEPVKTGVNVLNSFSDFMQTAAGMAQTVGQFDRRKEEWDHQVELAESELKQMDKQLVGIDIKIAMAELELSNHKRQIELAEEATAFIKDKFTNAQLYNWMLSQMSSVYFQTYQLAFEMAKRAEMCYKHELGIENISFIKFGYWNSLKKGLMAGEKLLLDIRRMDVSYLENNSREYEISKSISLALLDPIAILNLRLTGVCEFEIPEVLFDMDYPGHYFRRIKSVSISIPCVTGPYTSINAKLTMLSNKYRKETSLTTDYAEDPNNDERFVYELNTIKAIAASHAQNDSGMFELNFRDERYLPFERNGAVSRWRLELPTEVKQFNYGSITDAIILMNYTAREGGETLKSASSANLKQRLEALEKDLGNTGLFHLVDLRKDMPNQWYLLKTQHNTDVTIEQRRLPYLTQSFDNLTIESVMVLVRTKDGSSNINLSIDQNAVTLAPASELPLLQGNYTEIDFDTPFSLSVNQNDSENLVEVMLLVNYKV